MHDVLGVHAIRYAVHRYTTRIFIATARAITMANLRQKIELALILFFTLIGFASYHPETGSTAWLQWLTLVILLFFTYTFDASFTDQSSFIFDPDAVSAALSLSLSRRSGRPAGALRDVPPCRSSPLSHHFLRECMPPPPSLSPALAAQDNWRRKTEAGQLS